jgi:hypothetical protein
MDKRQIIEAIRQINTNAEVKFLQQFGEADLNEYLVRLKSVTARPALKAWTRPVRREYSQAS